MDPRVHAGWDAVLGEILRGELFERIRRVELALNKDGTVRADRLRGTIADEAMPAYDPYSVAATPGSGYQTVGDQLAATGGTYAPLASPTFSGTVTAPNLSVTTALTTVDLTSTGNATLGNADSDVELVQGIFKLKGAAPSIAVGVALGTGGSVGATISGCDQTGQLTITAGTASLATGRMATITFATAHTGNYAIQLTQTSTAASSNVVQWTASGLSSTQWAINCAAAPVSGGTYNFYYHVDPWTN